MLLGPVIRIPAALVENGMPLVLIGLAQALAGLDLGRNMLGQLFLEKSLHLGAKRLFLGGELQIHCYFLVIHGAASGAFNLQTGMLLRQRLQARAAPQQCSRPPLGEDA